MHSNKRWLGLDPSVAHEVVVCISHLSLFLSLILKRVPLKKEEWELHRRMLQRYECLEEM